MYSSQIASWVLIFIFAVMFIFQMLLAFGAPFGRLAWGGEYKILPKKLRVGSFISAIIFILAEIVVMEKVNKIHAINQPILAVIFNWFLVVLFAFSTIVNILSKSKWEKRIMTPIAFIIFLLCIIIAIN